MKRGGQGDEKVAEREKQQKKKKEAIKEREKNQVGDIFVFSLKFKSSQKV